MRSGSHTRTEPLRFPERGCALPASGPPIPFAWATDVSATSVAPPFGGWYNGARPRERRRRGTNTPGAEREPLPPFDEAGPCSDGELAARFLQGDVRAFEGLVIRY